LPRELHWTGRSRLRSNEDGNAGTAVFTRNIQRIFQAIKRLNFGGVIINDTPVFRAEPMPYGGNRRSGLGCEGVRYAIEEMTNIQMVAIRLD
jgi:acyl-CoA reductase-like NAD-dependent aldehyde dehydrogenase